MVKQIEFVHLAGPFGDCCSSYTINFPEGITIENFISIVVQENPNEWGSIGLGCWVSPKLAEYRDGSITYTENYEAYKSKKIIKANSHGGWSLMDYHLYLED